jgi:hypothetical protein
MIRISDIRFMRCDLQPTELPRINFLRRMLSVILVLGRYYFQKKKRKKKLLLFILSNF